MHNAECNEKETRARQQRQRAASVETQEEQCGVEKNEERENEQYVTTAWLELLLIPPHHNMDFPLLVLLLMVCV